MLTGKEAKDSITGLMQKFSNLREEDKMLGAVINGRHASYLLKQLTQLGYPTPAPMPSTARCPEISSRVAMAIAVSAAWRE